MASVLTLPNWDRVPWLGKTRALELNLDQRPSPRIFVSHFQYSMMPKSFYKVKPKDLKESVSKIAHFMGKSLSEEVSAKIADHCTFKNMKQNKMSNYSLVPEEIMDQKKSEFLRKGTL
ncbi:hypothetical protein SKAU_G00127020 [Synaphobranchus kaupii]|uniref:Sulfotransferase n=1 Tax=Synaphobranchus kaupii TaxID=118154 RepID=A0A9Q1FQ78_SYNKA|nr:hypothetical protein SKAU_G00127020 [Synaphobranchus kaupii]